MFIQWDVFPLNGIVTEAEIPSLPFVPTNFTSECVSFVSATFDTTLCTFQQQADDFITGFLTNTCNFDRVFNYPCRHRIEIHGANNYCLTNITLRELINCDAEIVIYSS